MLSLRSLAFILASAIRRARALSCAALQCFPDIIGRKIAIKSATKIATRMAAGMAQSPANSLHLSRRDHASAQSTPFETSDEAAKGDAGLFGRSLLYVARVLCVWVFDDGALQAWRRP